MSSGTTTLRSTLYLGNVVLKNKVILSNYKINRLHNYNSLYLDVLFYTSDIYIYKYKYTNLYLCKCVVYIKTYL